jgi:hypothetical protein
MKLTTEQIDQLYLFTRQRYVEWYDLQSELVDHLANAIEAQLELSPKRTFDEALNIEFKKFGIYGFMDVVEKRRAVLNKKYYKIVWQYFKDFFSIPKIGLTIIMNLALFIVLKLSVYREYIFMGTYLLLFVTMFYELYKNHKTTKNRKQSGEKLWLFEEVIHNYGSFSAIIIFPFNIMINIFNHPEEYLINDYLIMGLSFFLVSFSLFLFIIFKIIPSKTQTYLEQTYPEYKYEKL